ncbi:MAG: NUDIX hydrolase [Candidatus Berkelbacteria bacterium]
MKTDSSFGVIPIYQKVLESKDYYFLIVKQQNGDWGFPKGHAEKDESDTEAAQRELFEETGIDKIDLIENPSFVSHYTYNTVDPHNPDGDELHKTVIYYPAFTSQYLRKIDGNEILSSQWVTFDEAIKKLTFQETKDILIKLKKWLDAPEGQIEYSRVGAEQHIFQRVSQKGLFRDGEKILMGCDQNDVWELLGGTVEMYEDLDLAFSREMKEELGLENAKRDQIVGIYENKWSNDILKFQYIIIIYECASDLSNMRISTEHKELRWVTRDEAKELNMKDALKETLLKIMK